MTVYGVHTSDIWDGESVMGLYANIEDAVKACITYVDFKQKEWDHKYQNSAAIIMQRWRTLEGTDKTIKSWGNGISYVYIIGYEVK